MQCILTQSEQDNGHALETDCHASPAPIHSQKVKSIRIWMKHQEMFWDLPTWYTTHLIPVDCKQRPSPCCYCNTSLTCMAFWPGTRAIKLINACIMSKWQSGLQGCLFSFKPQHNKEKPTILGLIRIPGLWLSPDRIFFPLSNRKYWWFSKEFGL